ncbi:MULTISPECIES: hypothetical protein [unclassified Pseudoalteromonas]|uniref:hypothetical protein n=1 Tax=unclassified Pseudoalteromonas TaxID=194690 RepID=UPI00301433FB
MAQAELTKPAVRKLKQATEKDFATRAQQYKNVLDALVVSPQLKTRLKQVTQS